ncbi:DNA/RNA non-specific endonuclease [Nocardia vinacea]|uniref:DNA/RNA non-specific endonuclease n=1 Tax=Nocardia vinacea TaxID=96468 RepID=UPI00341CC2ED
MSTDLEAVARLRLARSDTEIRHSVLVAARGNPFAAEPDPRRIAARLQAKSSGELSADDAQRAATVIHRSAQSGGEGLAAAGAPLSNAAVAAATRVNRPEKIYGDTLDFVNVAFLEKGTRVARAVARVAFRTGNPQGSGFLIGPGLFLTNHHVVPDVETAQLLCLEFDYELDLAGRPRPVTRYAIDTSVFVTDDVEGLDFTIVAVGARIDGDRDLTEFGFVPLSDSSEKHMLGEFANIVQHPMGRLKEVVLRENRLVARLDEVLHYVADTEPGSSGSPAFNSDWQVIALHHWGGPWRQVQDAAGQPLPVSVNEGIRITAILAKLGARLAALPEPVRNRIDAVIELGKQSNGEGFVPAPIATPPPAGPVVAGPRMSADGAMTWMVPIEISIRIPQLPAQPTVVTTSEAAPRGDYAERSGYNPNFLPANMVALPRLSPALARQAAPNKQARPGDDPFELRYHHFSVVVNRSRKLAFFTASNIDGSMSKSVDRKTKTVKPLLPTDPGLESMNGAEAAETWYTDPRIEPGDCAGAEVYARQEVPGFPSGNGRIARMFQRGHLVRRLDPVWGSDDLALAAELDTFHFTNCTPQVGFFNQGTADPAKPGTGGGRLWRAVENYVLRNAVAEHQRVTCFTGPVFDEADRTFRGIRVPGRFFKIAVWVEGGRLRSLAMLADQRPVLEVWPEALEPEALGEENFQDSGELDRVADFLSTVKGVEKLTGLDFGDAVRAADIRTGLRQRTAHRPAELLDRR